MDIQNPGPLKFRHDVQGMTDRQHLQENKRMEKFQKSPSGMLQKMKDMEEFCDVTLISDDDKRFRAHKVVLASASTLFRDMFQNYDEETEYQVIHMRGVS